MDRLDVERAMHGDRDAFATIVAETADRLYRMARLILRDGDRAEDAVQEALVRAWRELPRLRDPARCEAWLRRMVVNACYDEGRRVRRRAEVSLVGVSEIHAGDGIGSFIESERIAHAFRRLPLEQRAVLVLHHRMGLSHPEIAESLGIPLGTVKSRLRRAHDTMRAGLDADDRVGEEARKWTA
jgi:RNA polymerase sigma-70 factor (ECF subfamily)